MARCLLLVIMGDDEAEQNEADEERAANAQDEDQPAGLRLVLGFRRTWGDLDDGLRGQEFAEGAPLRHALPPIVVGGQEMAPIVEGARSCSSP